MAGVKGKSGRPSTGQKRKINSAIDQKVYDKLVKYADQHKWSVSSAVNNILEEYFKKQK